MSTIDKIEVEKFSKLAKDWWNPEGKFKPLHLFNSTRIEFIKKKLISYFKLNIDSKEPLRKLKILDIGCGGGLLCEPLSRMGATMTGIDASKNNIEVAKLHSNEMGLDIKYFHSSPEKFKIIFICNNRCRIYIKMVANWNSRLEQIFNTSRTGGSYNYK